MRETDSRECRACHSDVWKDMSAQFGSARRKHSFAIDNNLTCIDCHQGIAHELPKGFVEPTQDELMENPRGWLERIEELAAAQPAG